MTQKTTDIIKQVVAMLSALMLFLGTVGITFEWFTLESIDAFGVFLGAFVLLVISLYGVYMNTYAQWKAFRLADEKKTKRLEEEGKNN